ncbi:MAG TPA: LPS assembly protein LptD [Gammaproteobacteria bacterium]|nr:LPS assembly protein LptD [Gammaproteobacteria bacterium]
MNQPHLVLAASHRSIIAFWLVVGLAPQSFAQDLCLVPSDPFLDLPPAPTFEGDEPIEITGRRFALGADNELEFEGEVVIRQGNRSITAENARRDENGDFEALGRVNLVDPEVTVFGEDAHYDSESETISFSAAGFDLPKRPARGSADQIEIRSDSRVSLANVLFTTCPKENVAWELSARDIELDVNGGIGKARGVKLDFKGVPILYAPYFTFPINDARKSGFLTPDISSRDRTGFDLSVPYYLNLAQNYDLTLEPRYMSKRGTQARGDFRYLLRNSRGEFGFEYLPDDDETQSTRRYVNMQHESLFGMRDQLQVLAGIEEVSDEQYFEDLGSSLSVTSQTHLNRFLDLTFFAPNWSVLTRFQNYQTIDPVLTDLERPYERTPQIVFDGRWLGNLLAFDSNTELVNFERNIGTTGWRLDSTQELSLRFARAGMFLTPAIALRQTNYWIDDPAPGEDDRKSRSLPIGSLDMGLKFERDATRGTRTWAQTLEPRLLYVRVPFEDQSDLPVFDTILPDFNLIQLFRKYQFVGPDRIADTDQLSFGVTTRLIDSANGRERMTATLGQTRYLNAQRVTLPGTSAADTNASDYVAEVGIGLRDSWALDMGYQWNSQTSSTARTETRLEYRPQEDRLFGMGYRYRRGALEQGDVSLVWPVSQRWRIIGRYSYSFLDKERLEDFFGWEYEACCWRLRMVNRNYVSRRTGEIDNSISLQLELKGLSQRVTAPDDLLERGILGYRNIARAY